MSNQLPKNTYTEISEVLVVIQSIANQKGIRYLKTDVWGKTNKQTNKHYNMYLYYISKITWILEWLALYKANSILITFIRKSVGLWNTTQETKSKAIT